jgi:lipid-binding SYLF domain-containing protein
MMRRFNAAATIFLATLVMVSAMTTASAAAKLDKRVDSATEVLDRFTRIPEQGIPPKLLKNAYAIAVVPNLIKAGIGIGGSFGQGILVVRQPDGRWSNPTFIRMGAGSVGFQVGAQSSDVILVFKNRKGVDNIAAGKVRLGGDASAAAGPVGRYISASTDGKMKAEIYSYSRNRGLFAGVSLEGAWIAMDERANNAFYQDGQNTDAAQILSDTHIPTPAHARRFLEVLSAKAPALEWQPQGSRQAVSRPTRDTEEPSGARVYSMDDAPAPASDSVF